MNIIQLSGSLRWTPHAAVVVVGLMGPAASAGGESSAVPGRTPRHWYDPRRYADRCVQAVDKVRHIEIVEMLWTLAHGRPPGDGQGWFHGGRSRYGWQWLADRYDKDDDGKISSDEVPPETSEWLARLDRDENGKIEQDDFDWSSDSAYVKQASQTRRLFGPIDGDRNGRITQEEWRSFFDQAALAADSITPADLQAALFPPQPEPSGDDPSPLDFLKGFATGELGSISQGPRIGQRAPDFELSDHRHERRIRLSQFHEKKPVVLIFGSFT